MYGYFDHISLLSARKPSKLNIFWRPPNLSELIIIVFNMELTHLGSEFSNNVFYLFIKFSIIKNPLTLKHRNQFLYHRRLRIKNNILLPLKMIPKYLCVSIRASIYELTSV